ncbi:serine/threonine-protein kinase [Roseiconus lacunae]|uniref:serine/threonine-protein kinase n=1 Tax=Roseiconus lacunae TaxID=2605694 RepID=UPI001E35EED9|nr:serine/threonine-protein kinase [Roseiconus lacunae]MCD0463553.1 serine/threonine protein kinase [Roseiconus lacunae]
MQIKCPHCQTTLSLGTPKAGRYKPTCKKCNEPFLLTVSQDLPPKVRVRKPQQKTSSSANQSSAHRSASHRPAEAASQSARRGSQRDAKPDESIDQSNLTRPVIDPNRTRGGSSSDGVQQTGLPQDSRDPAASIANGDLRSSSKSAESEAADRNAQESANMPARLGGYRLIRLLGRGAMGAVYQAKQVSLDRDVALKTIRGRLTSSPASLARFTREAYAAAQLTHHNVVQIYDFGEDNGQHYFSMEWVRGGSLADLVREKGRVAPKLAATYILQAARGLQFAHRNGMVHRDVKPANLLLADDGVVKVADLGLVKIPDQVDPDPVSEGALLSGLQSGTQVTMQGTAVGTPAYMAPEQSADSSSVDHRADIYSLGCSLFYLLAGQSPFLGDEPADVLQQHASAPPPDLTAVNARVPDKLARVVARSMAKRPSERYASLAEMIDDLQAFLGLELTVGFSPTNEQADRWESLASAYAKTQRMARLTSPLLLGLTIVMLMLTLAMPFSSLSMILLPPALLIATCLTVIVIGGMTGHHPVADHLRRWLETLSIFEMLVWGVAAIALTFVTVMMGLWLGAIIGLIVGVGLGTAYHFAVLATAEQAGRTPLDNAKRFIRDLRIEGIEENSLRDFAARFAGPSWQTAFEAVFGYEAMAGIRSRLAADQAFTGPTKADSVRDRLCRYLADKIKAKREAEDRRKLARLEQQSLVSQGVSNKQAEEQAWQVAAAVMEGVQKVVDSSSGDERVQAEAKRQRIKAMLADARSGKYKRPRDRHASWKLALSGYTRMLLGCMLLTVFAFAVQASGVVDEALIASARQGDLHLQDLPLDATTDVLGVRTSVWSVGIAGLLLCMSAFVSGWRMSPFAAVATIVILFGPALAIPSLAIAGSVTILPWMIAVVIAMVIYLPGVIYGEEAER